MYERTALRGLVRVFNTDPDVGRGVGRSAHPRQSESLRGAPWPTRRMPCWDCWETTFVIDTADYTHCLMQNINLNLIWRTLGLKKTILLQITQNDVTAASSPHKSVITQLSNTQVPLNGLHIQMSNGYLQQSHSCSKAFSSFTCFVFCFSFSFCVIGLIMCHSLTARGQQTYISRP